MAVTRKAMAITLWCVCGGVLIIVIILLIVFLVLRKRRLQYRKTKDTAYIENNTTTTTTHRHHHLEGADGGSGYMFAGFQLQSGVRELISLPPSGLYRAPQIVYLQPMVGQQPPQAPDILVSIQYQPTLDTTWVAPGACAATGTPQLLGQEAFLLQHYRFNEPYTAAAPTSQNNFLLYTTPLFFQSIGTYVVLAHTINPITKVVGTMHQFVFLIDLNGTVQMSDVSHHNTIDIGLNRGSSAPATPTPPPPQQLSLASTPPPQQPGFLSTIGDNRSGGADAAADGSGYLLPPRVTPSVGEVTTTTRILITPTYKQQGVRLEDKILYSTDGSEPNMVYQGPFTLAMHYQQNKATGSRGKREAQWVTIRAVAVSNNNNHHQKENYSHASRAESTYIMKSAETQVRLRVRPAGYSYYDPAVPSPCATVRTSNASLYFDETNSQRLSPASNPTKYVTVYQIIYLKVAQHAAFFDQMRDEARGGGQGDKKKRVKLDLRKCLEYKGVPIHISEDIFQVYAWTLERAVYERKRSNLDSRRGNTNDGGDSDDDNDPHNVLWRSPACVYDCTMQRARELPSYSIPKAIQKLREMGGTDAASLRPPPSPVMCVSCSEVELIFEDPPANSKIAYTINGTEPALFDVDPPACAAPLRPRPRKPNGDEDSQADEDDDTVGGTPPATHTPRARTTVVGDADGKHTYLYHPGKRITLSLLAAQAAHLTARVFIPVYEDAQGWLHGSSGGQGGSGGTLLGYRYGDVFYRAFYFDGGDGKSS